MKKKKDTINHAYIHASLQHDLHTYMHSLNSANQRRESESMIIYLSFKS